MHVPFLKILPLHPPKKKELWLRAKFFLPMKNSLIYQTTVTVNLQYIDYHFPSSITF